jgi:5,10-methylenetetrahydromethanopterin reductase
VSRWGLLMAGDDLATWRRSLRAVPAGGFWGIGLGDSPSLYPDPYAQGAVAALEAPGLHVGPWVSNPLLRHPVVTARALHSLDVLTGGRAFLGIGTGDSAVRNAGLRPADLGGLERYVRAVRSLLEEGGATWDGADVLFREGPRHIPIYLAASGPRGLELAGRVADGAIVGAGLEPQMIARAKEAVATGARAGGRRLEDLDLWWPVVASLADDDQQALAMIRAHLVTFAHFGLGRVTDWHGVPRDLVPALARVQERYRSADHAQSGAGAHAELADELGVTGFLAERFAVAGTAATVVRRVAELRERGIDRIWVSLRIPDKPAFLDRWQAGVLPGI